MKFKIGDRVRAVKPYDGNEMIVGKTGTVVCLEEILIGVEFDGSIDGHSCRSNGKMDHCWWCSEEILEPNANCSDDERNDYEKTSKKFIDAEMLIAELDASCMPIFEKGISGILGDNESIVDVIRSQPAADVQEVRHGKWFGTVCTACGESTSDYYDCDYCPHCGARMDGENMDKRYIKELLAKQCHDTGDCKQLKRLPCPDVVEVVRCKDCVYYETGKDYTPYCNHINGLDEAKDNDFCSYGERKRW